MLEICVSLRRTQGNGAIGGGEKTEKLKGDIICAKVSPAVWGKEEKKLFLITLLDDSTLQAKVEAGDTVISYPYAVYDESDPPEMINRSKYRVDLDMFTDSPGLDPEDESEPVAPNGKDNLEISDLILDASSRE